MKVVHFFLYFFINYLHHNFHFIVGIHIFVGMFGFHLCDYFSHKRAGSETSRCRSSSSANRACIMFFIEPPQYTSLTKLMPTVHNERCISDDATAYDTCEIWCCRHGRNTYTEEISSRSVAMISYTKPNI